jgi:hypothetical protein
MYELWGDLYMIRRTPVVLHLLFLSIAFLSSLAQGAAPSIPDRPIIQDPLSVLLPPPKTRDGDRAAEVIDLQPSSYDGPRIKGYKLILSGKLHKDLTIDEKQSPCLVRGTLVIPRGRTLALGPGAAVHLHPKQDNGSEHRNGSSNTESHAQVWCLGRMLAEGLKGHPIRILGPKAGIGEIHFSGSSHSELRGASLSGISVTQLSSNVHWIGCVFERSPHYALASGAASFIHCTLRNSGGIIATYDKGQWALLVRRSVIKDCEEGIVVKNDPGARGLDVAENSFSRTRGAHLRAWPRKGPERRARREFLIGENWYGTTIPEHIDQKIIDGRTDPGIRARINTRPPALTPYKHCGAHAPLSQIARTYHATTKTRKEMTALCTPKKKTGAERKNAHQKRIAKRKEPAQGT